MSPDSCTKTPTTDTSSRSAGFGTQLWVGDRRDGTGIQGQARMAGCVASRAALSAFEVIDVAGEDRFGQSSCDSDEMSVDDVGAARASEQAADSRPVVERIDHDRVPEPSEARSAGTIPPHLRGNIENRTERRGVDQEWFWGPPQALRYVRRRSAMNVSS